MTLDIWSDSITRVRWLTIAGLGLVLLSLVLPWSTGGPAGAVAGWRLGADEVGIGGPHALGFVLIAVVSAVAALVWRRTWLAVVAAIAAAFAGLCVVLFTRTLQVHTGYGAVIAAIGCGVLLLGMGLTSFGPGALVVRHAEPRSARRAALIGVMLCVGGAFLPWVSGGATVDGELAPSLFTILTRTGAVTPAWMPMLLVLPVAVVAAIRPTRRGRFRLTAGIVGLLTVAYGVVGGLLFATSVLIVEAFPDGTGGGVYVVRYFPAAGVAVTSIGLATIIASSVLLRRSQD